MRKPRKISPAAVETSTAGRSGGGTRRLSASEEHVDSRSGGSEAVWPRVCTNSPAVSSLAW